MGKHGCVCMYVCMYEGPSKIHESVNNTVIKFYDFIISSSSGSSCEVSLDEFWIKLHDKSCCVYAMKIKSRILAPVS